MNKNENCPDTKYLQAQMNETIPNDRKNNAKMRYCRQATNVQCCRQAIKMPAKKGQIQMVDLIISIAVFVLMIVIVYSAWQKTVQQAADAASEFRAQQSAINAANAIVLSPGNPAQWEALSSAPDSAQIYSLGGAKEQYVMSSEKISALAGYFNNAAYYDDTKLKLGIGAFDADIRISYLETGTLIAQMGNSPSSEDIVAYTHSKLAIYENRPAIVRVRIWQEG